MALSEGKYNLADDWPLLPDDTPTDFLHQFEYDCARPNTQMSDDAMFAYATGQPLGRSYTPQERDEARRFQLDAFKAAGMSGTPTKDAYQKVILQDNHPSPLTDADHEELDVFNDGVR